MSERSRASARRRLRPVLAPAAFAAFVACLGVAAGPGDVAAHVNRAVGPYTILLVLVEEPTFEDNHAGFQFWVRRDGQPITGLDTSIRAEATGHGTQVELVVPPIDGVGFYVLDRTTAGQAFDPLGGGAWSLRLTGTIKGTPIDETLPVTFPSYPRIGTTKPATAPADQGAGWGGLALPAVAALALGAVLLAGLAVRRFRPRLAPPTHVQGS